MPIRHIYNSLYGLNAQGNYKQSYPLILLRTTNRRGQADHRRGQPTPGRQLVPQHLNQDQKPPGAGHQDHQGRSCSVPWKRAYLYPGNTWPSVSPP